MLLALDFGIATDRRLRTTSDSQSTLRLKLTCPNSFGDCYIALLSVRVIANAVTLIGREFSQLVYIFELMIETQGSNRYVEKLSSF
jgi:hypothetical protein